MFPLLQWQRALHHSSQRLALRMVILGLCAAARPWKQLFRRTASDDAARGSLELGSECCNGGAFLHASALAVPVLHNNSANS